MCHTSKLNLNVTTRKYTQNIILKYNKIYLTMAEDNCTKAKPLFCWVCLSLIRRILFTASEAYGDKAVMIDSTTV